MTLWALPAVHDNRVVEGYGLELERDGERPQDVLRSGKPNERSRTVELGLGNADSNPAVWSSPTQRTLTSKKAFNEVQIPTRIPEKIVAALFSGILVNSGILVVGNKYSEPRPSSKLLSLSLHKTLMT